ncbi:MAG: HAD family hydrolase [Lachnospiraceae bacterium]|nr:HAD family hydrolase [Lachnospiraceae bacterium]
MSDRVAVFFDIDGTLWDIDNHIPESTVLSVRKLREKGHLAFLNTGRCRSFVKDPNLLNIGFDGIVSGCGTMIEYHDEVVFYHRIPRELAEKTISCVREFGFRPILEGRKYLYMDDKDFRGEPYGQKVKDEMGENLLSIEDNWGNWEMSKFSCATTDCDIDACYRAIRDDFHFIIHNEHVVEVVPNGFDKGTGIRKVCELLDIPPENTVAIGDSVNDIEMLEAAGTSIAMGNGVEEIKSMVDYVTTPMLEDGIQNALEHLKLI